MTGHHGCVNTVNFSDSGDYIMSGSDDTHILLFDTWTHRLKLDIANTMHIANVFHAINIPYSNENEIISCALDGKVVIHNLQSNEHKMIIQSSHSVHRAAINKRNPKVIYCCCENGELMKYDRRNDRKEPIFNNYRKPLYTLNINPLNDHEIMCGGEKGILTFLDLRKTNIPLFALKHPSNNINYNNLKTQRVRYSYNRDITINNSDNNNTETTTTNIPPPPIEVTVNPTLYTPNNSNNNTSPPVEFSINPRLLNRNNDNENSESDEVFEDISDASVDENLIGNEDVDSEENEHFENQYQVMHNIDIAGNEEEEVRDNDEEEENENEEDENEEEEEEIDDVYLNEEEEEEEEGGENINFRDLSFFSLFESNSLTSAKYNFNGTKCVVSYQNGDILLYDLKNSNIDNNDNIYSEYLQLYKGHQNIQTIKEVNFYGENSEYVISGSDTGHIFMWDTFTGEIVTILEADEIGAVNCIQQHPNYIPYIVSSGLSNTVSVWTPLLEKDADLEYLKDDLHLN